MTAAELAPFIDRFPGCRMLVIGDLMLDEFIWGNVARISPEAPVPVVDVTGESYYAGGAANVARNLREFTPHVAVIGLIGDDQQGVQLRGLLDAARIDTAAVHSDPACRTIVKTRIIARHQQVVRVDRERRVTLTAEQMAQACRDIDRATAECDGIILADYGKGFLSQPLADYICLAARRQSRILTVDPHPHTRLAWHGVTAIKPNRQEAFAAAGMIMTEPVDPPLDDAALIEAGQRLLGQWDADTLLVTLGEQGMLLFHGGGPARHIPTRAREVFDVSGAGDTAISVFTLGLCAGASSAQAAELANHASGVVVGKLGTATLTPAELKASLDVP